MSGENHGLVQFFATLYSILLPLAAVMASNVLFEWRTEEDGYSTAPRTIQRSRPNLSGGYSCRFVACVASLAVLTASFPPGTEDLIVARF